MIKIHINSFSILKMDIPGALTPEECMDEMDLDKIRDKAWHITLVIFSYLFKMFLDVITISKFHAPIMHDRNKI